MRGDGAWRAEGRADARDAAAMAAATLPLSLAVADVGVRSGVEPWLVLACSALVFSAAVQLLVYQLAAPQPAAAAALAWAAVAMLGLRTVLYAVELNQAIRHRPLRERLLALFFLTDISFLEFRRTVGGDPARALRRYRLTSRALWASWQAGTAAGLATGLTLPGLPKEAVGVLLFSCLFVSVFRR